LTWNVVAPCEDGSRVVWEVVLGVDLNLSSKLRLWRRDQAVGSEVDLEEGEEDLAIGAVEGASGVAEEGEDLEGAVDSVVTEEVEHSEAEVVDSEIGVGVVVDLETEEGEADMETEEEADSEAEEMTLVEEALGNRFVLMHLTFY
jgi:hypothetical protein